MKTIKIIDLLNKIANGEEVPKKIKFDNQIWNINYGEKNIYYTNYCDADLFIIIFRENLNFTLNDEIEILEEEKKMPEKLGYFKSEEQLYNMSKIILFNDIVGKINEILDYLEAKGE